MEIVTTIKIQKDTKKMLDGFREYKNESYDEVLRKIVNFIKNIKKEPQLRKDVVEAMEKAVEDYKKGKFVSEEDVKKRLGWDV